MAKPVMNNNNATTSNENGGRYSSILATSSMTTPSGTSSAAAFVDEEETSPSQLFTQRVVLPTLESLSAHQQEQRFAKLLVGDVFIGSLVSFGISPFVAMVDQAVVQRSAGTHTIMSSVQSSFYQMVRHPTVYFRSPGFVWMWALYTGTYGLANVLRTLQEHHQQEEVPSRSITSHNNVSNPIVTTPATNRFADWKEMPTSSATSSGNTFNTWKSFVLGSSASVLVGTSAVNMAMSLLKDRAYAHLFGGHNQSNLAVPKQTYALWMLRDFMVVGASFILPTMAVNKLQANGYIDHTQAATTERHAQIVLPILSQILAAPLHLVGLDIYHRPVVPIANSNSVGPSRWWAIMQERSQCFKNGALTSVTVARMSRVVPGFSAGGVSNTYLRNQWRRYCGHTM